MRFFLSLLSILFLLFSCQYYNAYFNAEKSFENGIEALRKINSDFSEDSGLLPYTTSYTPSSEVKKNLKMAVSRAWRLIELYHQDADYADEALFLIGRAEYFLQEYPKAIEAFQEYLKNYKLREYWGESWVWLVDSYLASGDTVSALKQFDLAPLKDFYKEDRIKMLTRYGFLMLKQGKHNLAYSYLNDALQLADDKEQKDGVRLLLAEALFYNGEYDEALVHASVVYDDDINDELTKEALKLLIRTYIAKNDFIYTLKWIEEGKSNLDYLSDFSWYELQLGNLYKRRKEWDKAVKSYKNVIREYPKTIDAVYASYYISEYFRLEIGQYDSAFHYIVRIPESVIKTHPKEYAYYKKWKPMLQDVVNIFNNVRRDSLLLSIVASDSEFYSQPENLSFLRQEYFSHLQKMKKEDKAAEVEKAVNRRPGGNKVNNFDDEMDFDLEVYTNQDSLNSLISQIIKLKKDSSGFTAADSAALDSLNYMAEEVSKVLFKNQKFPFKSVGEIEKDYQKSLYGLSEKLLTRFEDFASAQYYYREYLNTFPDDTVHSARALFALGFIDWQNGRKPEEIKYFKEVLEKYPDSESADKILKLQGLEKTDSLSLKVKEFNKEYNKAQKMYFSGEIDSSLYRLNELYLTAPTESAKARIVLMKAYIFKDSLALRDSVFSCYETLAGKYGDTPYFNQIKAEYELLKNYYASLAAAADSLNSADSLTAALTDSSAAAGADSLVTVKAEADSIKTEKEGEKINLQEEKLLIRNTRKKSNESFNKPKEAGKVSSDGKKNAQHLKDVD